MPGTEQHNLGKDIHRSEQVKAWGRPEGRLNKNREKFFEKSLVMTVVGLCGAFEKRRFYSRGYKDEDWMLF